MPLSDRTIYEFGDFRLDPAENLLLKGGEPVPLKLKAFSTLVFLVENRGRLVEKFELMDEVWGDSFVEEAAVSKCIWTVRAALDDGEKKRFIQTVPKRGYRFIGDVEIIRPENKEAGAAKESPKRSLSAKLNDSSNSTRGVNFVSPNAPPESANPPTTFEDGTVEPPSVVKRRRAWTGQSPTLLTYALGLILALSAIAGAFALYEYNSSDAATVSTNDLRLAVLPLTPVNAEKRDRSLEFAIADALILKLSESKAFEVNRLNTIRKFVDLNDDPLDAGRELKVQYVLFSHYQVVDSRVRVTSQLLNVSTGNTEQTFRSEADLVSLFQVQDAIANDIGNAVLMKFGVPTSTFASRRGTNNEEAYSLYQEAWYLIDKGTPEQTQKAGELLDRALELDPNYAQAWAVRSHAYCQYAHLGGDEPLSEFTKAEPLLERSMAIDPNNAMAYTIRGTINRDFHWNFAEATANLKRAIELDPSLVLAHRVLAGVYYRNGQFAEAVEEERKAVGLHPTSLSDHRQLGTYLFAAGRRAEGIAKLDWVVEMNPKHPSGYATLWEMHHLEGNYQEAYKNFIKLKELYGVPSEEIAAYKRAHQLTGWPGVLRAELNLTLAKEPKGRYCNYKYYIASLAALVGNDDLALHYIEEAIRFRLIDVSFIKVDQKFDRLRSDPRFTAIINRLGMV